jgi:predicted phosphodiesterase
MRLSWFLSVLLLIIKNTAFFAQPKGIHISWNGNNKVNTSSTMGITWMNDMEDIAMVIYGTESNNLSNQAKADVKYSNDLQTYVSKITLKKLQPSTYYYYKAGSNQNGWSETFKFRTGPAGGDKSKIVVGLWSDTQNNGGNYNFEQTDSIVKQMSRNAYYFTIHNGDIVENGSVIKSWKGLFAATEPINANYPFMSVTGNHDVVNDTNSTNFQRPFPVYYDLFNLPNNQLNYSYNYGNTHFIAINSGWAQGAEKVGKVLFKENSEEYKWLETDLAKTRKNKNITWVILYSHYPVYSYGFSHIPTWQRHLKPLIDKYKIDLCLAGHRHVYERHKAVRGSEIFGQADQHTYDKPKGTIYITNGSCGGSLQGVGGYDLPTMNFTPKEKMYTYAIMTIEDRTINYTVFNKDGIQIDYCKITKE